MKRYGHTYTGLDDTNYYIIDFPNFALFVDGTLGVSCEARTQHIKTKIGCFQQKLRRFEEKQPTQPQKAAGTEYSNT